MGFRLIESYSTHTLPPRNVKKMMSNFPLANDMKISLKKKCLRRLDENGMLRCCEGENTECDKSMA